MASDVDPRFDPAFQRGFEPVVEHVETTTPVVEPRSPRVELVETTTPVVEPVESPPGSPARNPWLATLWITAAVFTIVGALTQYVAVQVTFAPTAETPAVEYVIPTVFSALSPWLFAAGLATAIAALVIHALRWQPRD